MNYKEEQSGVLLGRRIGDFVAGVNSPLSSNINVEDWKQYKPEHEVQFIDNGLTPFDTLACVSFSATDCIETLFMHYLHNGLIPSDLVLWLKNNGYFKNGFINFSDRFVAINGLTNTKGAYQYDVADGIKKCGLIPETMFPAGGKSQAEYLSGITKEMIDLGKESLKRFQFLYEWVEDLDEAIKHSPVQVIVRFANYTNPTDILNPSGQLNHAVMCDMTTNEYDEVNDSYWQEIKRYAKEHPKSFMAFHLNIINQNSMDTVKFLKDNDLKFVRNQGNGAFGRILQGKLRVVKSTDRGTLLLLDDKVRNGGISITASEWEQLPKEDF